MLTIELGIEGIGAVRMAPDVVWETAASLRVLNFPREHALHAGLRKLLPGRPSFDLQFLLRLTSSHRWQPDVLAPDPTLNVCAPLERIQALADTEEAVLRQDLKTMGTHLPDLAAEGMTPRTYAERVARELAGYWRQVMRPLWDELEAIAYDDIAHHSRRLSREGLGVALRGIHHEMDYRDGIITLDLHCNSCCSCSVSADGLWLVPSAFCWPGAVCRLEGPAIVVGYPARGAARIWSRSSPVDDPTALAALIGRSRADILRSLHLPRSTTWLARRHNLSPGNVSTHLSVLADSGLLHSHRDGRRVLYAQTDLGADLVEGGPRSWYAEASAKRCEPT